MPIGEGKIAKLGGYGQSCQGENWQPGVPGLQIEPQH